MLAVGSKGRLFLGLAGVFCLVVVSYLLASLLPFDLAIPVTIGLSVCILIFFIYRWQIRPPVYDRELKEIRALALLTPLAGDAFLPFSGWALEPDFLLDIVLHIHSSKCEKIVECGSGVSTIVIGNLIKKRGYGHLYSLEHDPHWHRIVSEQISRGGLEEFVTQILAPLQEYPWGDSHVSWYAEDPLRSALEGTDHLDLVVVDGPPSSQDLSRVMALPFLRPWMDDHTLLVLDDARRQQEKAVLAEWARAFDIEIELPSRTQKGQAHVRLRGHAVNA